MSTRQPVICGFATNFCGFTYFFHNLNMYQEVFFLVFYLQSCASSGTSLQITISYLSFFTSPPTQQSQRTGTLPDWRHVTHGGAVEENIQFYLFCCCLSSWGDSGRLDPPHWISETMSSNMARKKSEPSTSIQVRPFFASIIFCMRSSISGVETG